MSFYKKKDFSNYSDDEIYREAIETVFRSVSKSEQSSAKLFKKLKNKGFPDEIVEKAIGHGVDIGAIDDIRYSECLIRYTVMAGKGLKIVEREIAELGIDINALESYQEYIGRGEESHINDAIDYLSRKTPRSKNLQASCYRKLITRGYSPNIASTASRRFCEYLKENNDLLNEA